MPVTISNIGRFWVDLDVLSGEDIAAIFDTSPVFNGFGRQSMSAVGDSVGFSFSIKPGDYNVTLFGRTDNKSGIHDTFINGVLLNTDDRYTLSTVSNVMTTTPITITLNNNTFTSTVTGRRTASLGYDVSISHIFIAPV